MTETATSNISRQYRENQVLVTPTAPRSQGQQVSPQRTYSSTSFHEGEVGAPAAATALTARLR
jgi:hypothetical protein